MGDPNENLMPFPLIFGGTGIQAAYKRKDMMIRVSDLIPYKDNPFAPYSEDRLKELAESIREYGVLTPILVRSIADRKYEILSGHNRVEACRRIDEKWVPAVLAEVDDDTAAIMVTDSNLKHRERLLPSEKARAYKMRIDAIKRQAGRPSQDNCSQEGNNLPNKRSAEIFADEIGESKNQIFRYIRLLELVPDLLRRTDIEEIPLCAAVELSYICHDGQGEIARYLSRNPDAHITLAKAANLRRDSETFIDNTISEIISRQEKRTQQVKQKEGVSRSNNPYTKVIRKLGGILSSVPPGVADPDKLEVVIANAVKEYLRTLKLEASPT